MSSIRQLKYAGLIQKDLSEIFQRDARHWFSCGLITVTGVEVTPDLSIANIRISLMIVEDKKAFLKLIASKKSEIRKALGLKIGKQVRIVPDIIFFLDNTLEEAQKMDNLIAGLNVPSASENDEDED